MLVPGSTRIPGLADRSWTYPETSERISVQLRLSLAFSTFRCDAITPACETLTAGAWSTMCPKASSSPSLVSMWMMLLNASPGLSLLASKLIPIWARVDAMLDTAFSIDEYFWRRSSGTLAGLS